MKVLTKSRFKLALECPTKLFYTGKKEQYPDQKLNDEFLAALAKGGFQVGELAKCYFPGGINIDELDYDISLEKTNTLLKQENCIIYEAAFKFKNLFIRADVVVKKGNNIKLYEVKAKSFDSNKQELLTTKGEIVSSWKPYLYDITFQKYVICNAFPQFSVNAFLMLADKNTPSTVEGLNQHFFLTKDERGRNKIETIGDVTTQALGNEVLIKVAVDEIVDSVLAEEKFVDYPEKSFKEWVHFFADKYEKGELISSSVGSKCKECEFKATIEEENNGLLNGFKECWKSKAKLNEIDFEKPSILDIWDFRKKDEYISLGKYFQSKLTRADLEKKETKFLADGILSRVDRQELQITKSTNNDSSSYIDIDGIKSMMESFSYPLHFIDFETTAVAIPFNIGRKPYEQIAFQFSHHIIHKNGVIEHKGEWINTEQGKFPNFDFVRALKAELENDNGTIFRYAPHENSILNAIFRQLKDSKENDKDPLCQWIQTITKSTGNSVEKWEGDRNMVDLLELVKKYYYNPQTNGSNSIKQILPAILNSSEYLKKKYSQPIYGSEIKSLNFNNQIWITYNKGGYIVNPYKLLDPIFKGIDEELLDSLILEDVADLQDGGAAMTAYAQMQFTQMTKIESDSIKKALLKYCELDTLAMVMIWEEWNNLINKA